MQTLRTFVAIPIEVEEILSGVWANLRNRFEHRQVKWVSPDILHLTLFFLGETQPQQVEEIRHELAQKIQGCKPFSIELRGMGFFGPSHSPKVIWIGVEKNHELEMLYQKTNETIGRLGFTPDQRGFNPHITLGRPKNLKDPNALTGLLKQYNQHHFQTSKAAELVHYSSELRPEGAVYTKLYRIDLA